MITRGQRIGSAKRVAGFAIGSVFGPMFALASAVRGRRAVHPYGGAYAITVDVASPQPALSGTPLGEVGQLTGVVRFSHGLGRLPGRNDFRGFALRMRHADSEPQDILLLSAFTWGRRQMFALPSSYICRYCSVLPLVGPNGPLVFYVLATEAGIADQYFDTGAAAGFRFQLFAGAPHQHWYWCADIVLGQPLSPAANEDLRFSPFHDGFGLRPVDVISVVRRVVYRWSQSGRASADRRLEAAVDPIRDPAPALAEAELGFQSVEAEAGSDQASVASAARPGTK